MLPISSRANTDRSGTSSVFNPTRIDCIPDDLRQAPPLNSPAICPSDIAYTTFWDFMEKGTVPEDESEISRIACWCLKNQEPRALNTLLQNGGIERLDLDACELDADDAAILATVLNKNPALLQISLNENPLGSEGVKAICAALEENSVLIGLDLGANDIDTEGIHVVGAMLEKNACLESLNLSFNAIGVKGLQVLAQALEKNRVLTELNLGSNSIDPEGMGIMGKLVEKAPFLERLDLSGNDMEPGSGQLIADMLKGNTTLRRLDLKNTTLDSDDAELIFKALESNATLEHLSLAENTLDGRSATHIAILLQKNRTLSSLDFAENRIFYPNKGQPIDAIDSIICALERNTVVADLDFRSNHPIDRIGERPQPLIRSWIEERQRSEDLGRIDDLLQRNRTLDALAEQDAALCARIFPGQHLSLDEGKVLASAMIMAASDTRAYQDMMVEVQCSVNLMASQT